MKRSVSFWRWGGMLMVASAAGQQFQLMEASINGIHRGLQSGKLTCHSLVQQYLDRIKAYDQQAVNDFYDQLFKPYRDRYVSSLKQAGFKVTLS